MIADLLLTEWATCAVCKGRLNIWTLLKSSSKALGAARLNLLHGQVVGFRETPNVLSNPHAPVDYPGRNFEQRVKS
ncbi:MAG: hypothetical protein NZ550_05990 [Fimbriimonadales bacterium]|nr:hypothetical protein [Fimbriimonadales bacterium]MDW8052036.1 hypothetical protein [Armatimonadota bacterium]